MRKLATIVASIAIFGAVAVGSGAAIASSGTHAPKGNVTVVNDGILSCNLPKVATWYRYSNGYTWNFTTVIRQTEQVILQTDPQGRKLPKNILIHATYNGSAPSACVVDVFN
jgi:hypothetical protein